MKGAAESLLLRGQAYLGLGELDDAERSFERRRAHQRRGALIDAPRSAGQYAVRFDASGLPSGVYVYRITAGTYVETRRMVLTK